MLTVTGTETKRTVTKLTFENHTACECVGRNSDLMPRTEPEPPESEIRQLFPNRMNHRENDEKKKPIERPPFHHHQPNGTSSSRDDGDGRVSYSVTSDRSGERTRRPQPKSFKSAKYVITYITSIFYFIHR